MQITVGIFTPSECGVFLNRWNGILEEVHQELL